MCAIFGILTQKVKNSAALKAMGLMQAEMLARGPSATGQTLHVGQNYQLWLGHNRLAILGDQNTAAQPQTSSSGRWSISFNGQIYNFLSLAKQFEISITPQMTDTQLILARLEQVGLAAFEQFDGMFACAVIDNFEHKLWLVRDLLGVKPLFYHYCQATGQLVFASQIKALLASRLFVPTLDLQSWRSFLRWGTVLPPDSMFCQIKAVMPGQLLKFDLNLQQLCSSKQLAFKAFDEPLPELNLECFLQNLAQTISPTLKTGIFLSGGIDSASIACGLKVLGVADLTAFTIKIKPGPGLVDESELASNLAKKLGISHELLDLTNFNLIQSFEAFVAALDAPSTDGLNTFLLSQFAAGQVKVALSGLGGDELFFGYPQMRQFAWAQAHPRLFSFIKPLLPRLSGWQSLAPLLRRFNLDFLVNYRFDHQLEATLAARELLLAADPIAAYFGSDSLIVPQREASLTIQQAEFMAYTGPVLLSDSDCLSMASSLELRVPLLNPKFVQRALALSPEQLIGSTGWPNKPWFCKLLQALVPAYILRQPKAGFVLPVGSWLLASRKTFEAQLQQFKILPTEFAKNLWHDLAARPWRWRQLWGVLVLQTWLRQLKIDLPDKF